MIRLSSIVFLFPLLAQAMEPLPPDVRGFFKSHCFECHAGDDDFIEGEVNLEMTSIDWAASDSPGFWTKVYDVLHTSEMPPREAESFPTATEREDMTSWLEGKLTQYAPVGGTVPRRLNRVEYENTIRDVFGIPEFEVPYSFPTDDSESGFDNVASGLILSPPLLAEFLDLASQIADEILPPEKGSQQVPPQLYEIEPDGFFTSEGGGAALAEDRYRLASSRNMASAAAWTSPFEVPHSGIYRLQIDADVFQTDQMQYPYRESPFQLAVYARQNGEQKYALFENLRNLGNFLVAPGTDQSSRFQIEAELFKGEVIGLRWTDGPAYSAPAGSLLFSRDFILGRLAVDKPLYAALLTLKREQRNAGQVEFYEIVQNILQSGELDLEDPRLDVLPANIGGGIGDSYHNWVKAIVLEENHRFGPALDVLKVEVEGPFRLVEDEETRLRRERSQRFIGERAPDISDETFAGIFLRRFLSQTFRRPVTEAQLETYLDVVREHLRQFPEARVEDALHLAVRRALVSPHFLYRSTTPGILDDWDLASRLSYFLTSAPPDERLRELARKGELSSPAVLEQETRRLLSLPERKRFIHHFTGQWLGTRKLSGIMPDPRLFRFQATTRMFFGEGHRRAMIDEGELLFDEILVENHPLETFIDPGFSYRNHPLTDIYGGELEGQEMQRVTIPKGARHGGIVGMASIMMATANGVDTHPVHRGVWLLENVFGQPTPPPPPNVPAVAPDTSGTVTMREQMKAHTADPTCARCHERIDPLGYIMENFDPIGRWRANYPIYTDPPEGTVELEEEFYSTKGKGGRWGPEVDPSAILPDGTPLEDVTDLKGYLLENIDLFAHCLTEKLLTYAAGRPLGFGDRRVVQHIVEENSNEGFGFQDLIVAIVLSESFRTR